MTRIAFGAERRHIIRLRLFEFCVIATAGWVSGLLLGGVESARAVLGRA